MARRGLNRHRRGCRWRHAAACLLVAVLGGAASVRSAPLEVYGRLPRIEEVALSPDGSRIAFVKTEENNRVVTAFSVAAHTLLRGLRVGQQKLRYIEWADDNHLLIVTSVTTVPWGFMGANREWFQMQVYDVRNGNLFLVPQDDDLNKVQFMNAIGGRVTIRRLKDHTVLFIPGLQTSTRLAPALIRADLETQTSRVVRPGNPGNLGWIVDDAGEVVAEEIYNEDKRHWAISIRRDGHIEFPRLLGWGPTADTLLMERLEEGNAVWRLLSLKDGSIGPPMAEKKALDQPIENRLTNRMVGGVHIADSREYVFFEQSMQATWDAILNAFPGERVRLESASADFRKIIVRVEGAVDGYRFELVDLDTHRATPIGDVYEGVTQPFEVRRITYAAADGTDIPAYLTLPRGRPPKKLPLIVLPHGGPAARDTADFDWWSQALSDQGYAVLRPNYRGSDINWRFLSQGFGEWGKKMQTDLSDGVRYLAKEGIADPARVCIVGASYGGYAALAGPSLDPGVYRCAVAVAGIGDIRRMLTWVNDRRGSDKSRTQRYGERFMGVRGPDDPAVDGISPIKHLDAITVPVLLIHGRDDTVVDYEQSHVMYDALRKAKKSVELVTLKNEDHWLSRSGTRLQMLEASVGFLRAHNPPD